MKRFFVSLSRALPCLGVLFTTATLAAFGCSSKSPASPSDAGVADASPAAPVNYSGVMTCVDDLGETTVVPLQLNSVEACTYNGTSSASPTLRFNFLRSGTIARDHLEAQVVGFTMTGDYVPDLAGTGTTLDIASYSDAVSADGTHAANGGSGGGDSTCHGTCTISITDASVISVAVGATGRVAGTITCTTLAAAGIGCVQCTMAAPTIAFDIRDCSHAD